MFLGRENAWNKSVIWQNFSKSLRNIGRSCSNLAYLWLIDASYVFFSNDFNEICAYYPLNWVIIILTRRWFLISKLPHIVLRPWVIKSSEYSLKNVVLPLPVGPVKMVNSPARCPFNISFKRGNRFHLINVKKNSIYSTINNMYLCTIHSIICINDLTCKPDNFLALTISSKTRSLRKSNWMMVVFLMGNCSFCTILFKSSLRSIDSNGERWLLQ